MSNFIFIILIATCFSLFNEAQARGRIFNGTEDGDHKYFVSVLRRNNKSKEEEYLCGGAIIDNKYILTAAHCVYKYNARELYVRGGSPDKNSENFYGPPHPVIRYMIPIQYKETAYRHHQNDIALLKLARKIDLSDDSKYQKLNLPEYDNDYESADVSFTGYGAFTISEIKNLTSNETYTDFEYPQKLQYLESTVIPLEECRYNSSLLITDETICISPQNGFSCLKDGGGPLVYDGTVIGIRNKIDECSDLYPEIFTRVSKQLSFIFNVMNCKFSFDIKYVKG